MLASAIATTNSSWFARVFLFRWLGLGEKRYFDEQEFKRDVVRLQVLYRRSGYPHAQMDTVVRREPTNVYITFRITRGRADPGDRASTVTGLDTLPEKLRRETLVDLPLQAGRSVQPLHHAGHRRHDHPPAQGPRLSGGAGVHQLRDQHGTPRRRPSPTTSCRASGTVIGDGQRGRRQPDRRRWSFATCSSRGRAGTYSQDELFQSQRNLYSSDLFRFATVNIDSAAFDPAADSVPLVVQVNEARRRRDPRRPRLRHRRLLPRLRSAGPRAISWGAAAASSTSPAGSPRSAWGRRSTGGSTDSICGNSREDSVGSAKVNFTLGASVRRPAFLSPNNTIAVSLVHRAALGVQGLSPRRRPGTTLTLRRETPRQRIPLSLAYTLSYGHTEATPESFCASFNACTPDVVALLRQNRGAGDAHAPRPPSRGSTARSIRRAARSRPPR